MTDDPGYVRKQVAAYGRFTVHHDLLVHLPWGLYRIYAGERYIGAQISFPSDSDCRWMAAQKVGEVIYARQSHRWRTGYERRRGATSPAAIRWRKQKAAA